MSEPAQTPRVDELQESFNAEWRARVYNGFDAATLSAGHTDQAMELARQLERELAEARRKALEAERDTARLDALDRANAALNRHYGTNYGWRLILSPNIVRLMRDGRSSQSGYLTDIDLNDTEGGHAKLKSCRQALDALLSQPETKETR